MEESEKNNVGDSNVWSEGCLKTVVCTSLNAIASVSAYCGVICLLFNLGDQADA